jgi:hypothetical protein
LMRQRLFYTETGPFATPKFRYNVKRNIKKKRRVPNQCAAFPYYITIISIANRETGNLRN